MVGFNVRGADLGTLLARAEQRVSKEVKMPSGYRLVWGGQYETFAAARARLGILIPVVLLIIVVVLWRLFGSLRPTAILFSAVPFAGSGGMLALAARGMPISISAAIGFIALSGIAVLNGVVLMVRLLDLERQDSRRSRPRKRRRARACGRCWSPRWSPPWASCPWPWRKASGPKCSARWRRWWSADSSPRQR